MLDTCQRLKQYFQSLCWSNSIRWVQWIPGQICSFTVSANTSIYDMKGRTLENEDLASLKDIILQHEWMIMITIRGGTRTTARTWKQVSKGERGEEEQHEGRRPRRRRGRRTRRTRGRRATTRKTTFRVINIFNMSDQHSLFKDRYDVPGASSGVVVKPGMFLHRFGSFFHRFLAVSEGHRAWHVSFMALPGKTLVLRHMRVIWMRVDSVSWRQDGMPR